MCGADILGDSAIAFPIQEGLLSQVKACSGGMVDTSIVIKASGTMAILSDVIFIWVEGTVHIGLKFGGDFRISQ
jgi:hypothetical protein